MIAGLSLDSDAEERVARAFSTWADHFRASLAERGVEYLLGSYRTLVHSVETQTCAHGPNGTTLSGSAWRSCCGLSYEFSNDLAARDALDILLEVAPGEATASLRPVIAALDERLRRHYPNGSARGLKWWRNGLPREITE